MLSFQYYFRQLPNVTKEVKRSQEHFLSCLSFPLFRFLTTLKIMLKQIFRLNYLCYWYTQSSSKRNIFNLNKSTNRKLKNEMSIIYFKFTRSNHLSHVGSELNNKSSDRMNELCSFSKFHSHDRPPWSLQKQNHL